MADAHDTAFESAVRYISTTTSLRVPAQVKLRLYALYKIATKGSAQPPGSRPAFYDLAGRAKWDAWAKLGSELTAQDDVARRTEAQEAYIVEAERLGWTRDGSAATAPPPTDTDSAEGDDAGNGAVAVSQMQAEKVDKSIPLSQLHELAVTGKADELTVWLDERGQNNDLVNLDALDAYGFAPLHLAADRGHANVVRILVERGADKDRLDEDGNTALQLAELCEHDDVITLLKA